MFGFIAVWFGSKRRAGCFFEIEVETPLIIAISGAGL